MRIFVIPIVICCMLQHPGAQTIDFSASISYDYDGVPLEQVLEDLSARYALKFSYSRQIIPLSQEIYASADQEPVYEALEMLFENTPIVYGFIADQLVLSVDTDKQWDKLGDRGADMDDSVASLEGAGLSRTPRPTTTLHQLSPRPVSFHAVQPPNSDWYVLSDAYIEQERQRVLRDAGRDASRFDVQLTVMPPVQVRTNPRQDSIVNLSMNLLWGVNNAIEGLEMGGLVNVTRENFSGVQLAGLVNAVGLSSSGLQAAGVANITRRRASGMQMASVTNVAPEGGDLFQVSGVANVAKKRVYSQLSGVTNVGDEVHAQIGLVNVAREVQGVQIGLINVSDTIRGVPIGLISVSRKGYSSFEVAAQDAIHANVNVRLGVRPFYNILHVGANEGARTWSLGYGLGTSIRTGRRNFLQLELLSSHVNEEETWTNELNLLNQFQVLYDIGIGSRFRIVLGPSFNVAVSRRYDPETDTYGTQIPNYTFFDRTYERGSNDPVNVKYWVGFHAGIRLNSKESPHPHIRYLE